MDEKKFKRHVVKIFKDLKNEKKSSAPSIVPIYHESNFLGYLRAVSTSSHNDLDEIKRIAKWRKQSERWFPAQFRVTINGTKKWMQDRLLDTEDRFLFMINSPSGKPLGHVGLYRFNFAQNSCEIDNVVRGESDVPGIMMYAINAIIDWSRKYLKVDKFYLQVFSDNEKAIRLYKRNGFREIKKIALKKVIGKDMIIWQETKEEERSLRYNIYMQLSK